VTKLFISYRRSDSQDFSGRLADRLRKAQGISDVFLDVEEIGAGEDFVRRIQTALTGASVCLIVIGPDWRGATPDGSARIMNERDFVRLEVREALATPARILPVLANGALMPASEELPDDLKKLTTLNAVSVRHADFERDADHLLDAILARKKPGRLAAFLRRNPLLTAVLRAAAGGVLALTLLVLGLAVFNAATGLSLDQAVGGEGPALLLALAVTGLGAIMPWILRRHPH
jgi:hypothetical protein